MNLKDYTIAVRIAELFNKIIEKYDGGNLFGIYDKFIIDTGIIKNANDTVGGDGRTFIYTSELYNSEPKKILSVNFYNDDCKSNAGKVNGSFLLCRGGNYIDYKFDVIRLTHDTLLLLLRTGDEFSKKQVFLLKGSFGTKTLTFFEGNVEVVAIEDIKNMDIVTRAPGSR